MANNGSAVIYYNFIKPFVKKHEKTFEKTIQMTSELAKEGVKGGKGERNKEREWCFYYFIALGAAKDAAGNISLNDIQRIQEKTSELHAQFAGDDKKDQ